VTVNFDGVPAPDDKLTDAVIADPNNKASYWVDFHVLDPTSPSNRHIQRGNQLNSQAQSSLQHSFKGAYTVNKTTTKPKHILAGPATTTLCLCPS